MNQKTYKVVYKICYCRKKNVINSWLKRLVDITIECT